MSAEDYIDFYSWDGFSDREYPEYLSRATVVRLTDKAILVRRQGEQAWVPLSQVEQRWLDESDLPLERGKVVDLPISEWFSDRIRWEKVPCESR